MKTALGISALGLLTIVGALYSPTRIRLEIYDVQDLVYTLTDMPGVDISLARSPAAEDPSLICGEDLVNGIRAVLPGVWQEDTGRTIQFQNGLVIVRATAAQQAAVRSCLSARRVWQRLCR